MAEPDPIYEAVKECFQEYLIPELRSVKTEIASIDTRLTTLHSRLDSNLKSVQTKMDALQTQRAAQFDALMAAIKAPCESESQNRP